MALPNLYAIKRFLRICDCRLTPKKKTISFRERDYPFYSTYWWDNVSQEIFDSEIVPYFDALENFCPSVILDVGAATGHFGIIASKVFPNCSVYAFEPAQRQRILLARNVRLNHVENFEIEPFGLWNRSESLPFRTSGAESSFAPASRFQGTFEFPERVPVMALDQWVDERSVKQIDLIKIDAEGAEIEILEGARATLAQFRPRLLVQAYHLRDGARTFERCAEILQKHPYTIREGGMRSGLLCAT